MQASNLQFNNINQVEKTDIEIKSETPSAGQGQVTAVIPTPTTVHSAAYGTGQASSSEKNDASVTKVPRNSSVENFW